MISPSYILEHLIRFDTSNPPGHEKDCVLWIRDLLAGHGFQTELFAKDPERPNLVARMKGQGNVRPLLLYGHADVVPPGSRTGPGRLFREKRSTAASGAGEPWT